MITKERPILFNGPMVKTILAGIKTQTRRVVKPQPQQDERISVDVHSRFVTHPESSLDGDLLDCPYGNVGDRLWVRETFKAIPAARPSGYFSNPALIGKDYWYRATDDLPTWGEGPWRPSIFMPRKASRITLEITGVRVEKLQEISEADAMAEGCRYKNGYVFDGTGYDKAKLCHSCAITAFACLWDEINGPGSWDLNPWVWVVSFKRASVNATDAQQEGGGS